MKPMKPLPKRIYAALPRAPPSGPSTSSVSRVRSNSSPTARSLYTVSPSHPLSFVDSPSAPSPSSRPANPNIVISSRFAAEFESQADSPASHQHTQTQNPAQLGGSLPYTLALTSGPFESPSHPSAYFKPLFPYSAFAPALGPENKSLDDPAVSTRRSKQSCTCYHLDVGAYGIPKRSHGCRVAGRDGHSKFSPKDALHSSSIGELDGAVQVGEDAYFVRDNAMGVADGVGGWSKTRRAVAQEHSSPSPSAMFARRLMHYCSEEVDAVLPRSDLSRQAGNSSTDVSEIDMYTQLEDSLEELEEGLDVLNILEKAYGKTMRAHIRPPQVDNKYCRSSEHEMCIPSAPPTDNSQSNQHSPSDERCQTGHDVTSNWTSILNPQGETVAPGVEPLLEGSSTALVAVLEHRSMHPRQENPPSSLFTPRSRPVNDSPHTHEPGAVIKVVHLGDCMAMLIRGEEIIWRTEEMWWNFNTPVQLGPASPTRPRDAHVFTVPVQADDILILASDGLSDNLWDEEVLDEVTRFRQPYMANSAWSETSHTANTVNGAFGRSTLAAMLSEALCSRAHRVAEQRVQRSAVDRFPPGSVDSEIPFARRAREQGRSFHGGKPDDISVLVAIVSPVPPTESA